MKIKITAEITDEGNYEHGDTIVVSQRFGFPNDPDDWLRRHDRHLDDLNAVITRALQAWHTRHA